MINNCWSKNLGVCEDKLWWSRRGSFFPRCGKSVNITYYYAFLLFSLLRWSLFAVSPLLLPCNGSGNTFRMCQYATLELFLAVWGYRLVLERVSIVAMLCWIIISIALIQRDFKTCSYCLEHHSLLFSGLCSIHVILTDRILFFMYTYCVGSLRWGRRGHCFIWELLSDSVFGNFVDSSVICSHMVVGLASSSNHHSTSVLCHHCRHRTRVNMI